MHKITSIKGRQILDSRGNPTVEVDMILDSNEIIGRGVAPSGASTGKLEALELRDQNNNAYNGKSVYKAVDFINGEISDKIINNQSFNQESLDKVRVNVHSNLDITNMSV